MDLWILEDFVWICPPVRSPVRPPARRPVRDPVTGRTLGTVKPIHSWGNVALIGNCFCQGHMHPSCSRMRTWYAMTEAMEHAELAIVKWLVAGRSELVLSRHDHMVRVKRL